MLRSVYGKWLWDQRRALLGWIIGITAVGVGYAAFYPSINSPEMEQALEAYPQELLDAIGFTDIASAAGYLGSTSFGLLGPTLVIVMAAAFGGSAIAGDEEAGRLDLVLAHPVSRWSVLIQRFGAIATSMVIVAVVLAAALAAISGPAQLDDVGFANLAAAALHLAVLGTLFGALALCAGAVTGRRTVVYAVTAIVAVVGFFGNNLARSVDAIAWLGDISPFRYYSGGAPLVNGPQPADIAVLLVAAGVLVSVGGLIFNRRDVAV